MEHFDHEDKASRLYERAMESIHGHVSDAKEAVEDLSLLIDKLESKPSKEELDKAEELVAKAIISLCKIQ